MELLLIEIFIEVLYEECTLSGEDILFQQCKICNFEALLCNLQAQNSGRLSGEVCAIQILLQIFEFDVCHFLSLKQCMLL